MTERKERKARLLHLWALGAGAVVSGDFFGWNFGLAQGFGAMAVAVGVVAAMYVGLCACVAEMASLFPTRSGGAALFASEAFGRVGGFVAGAAQSAEYVLTPAVIASGIASYIADAFSLDSRLQPLLWLLVYALFVALNVLGVSASLNANVVIAIASFATLAAFYCSAVPHLQPRSYGPPWFPFGARGVFAALPCAMWLFLAVEEVPLATEDAVCPARDVPLAMHLSLATLTIFGALTLVVFSFAPPGAAVIAVSSSPLFSALSAMYGATHLVRGLSMLAELGLLASFHSIIYAYGRQLQCMAQMRYYPPFLALQTPKAHTPWAALVIGAMVGISSCVAVFFGGGTRSHSEASNVLLGMSVFGALLSYIVQLLAFIALRLRRRQQQPEPISEHGTPPASFYHAPLGLPGAFVTLGLCVVAMVSVFLSGSAHRWGLLGVAVWYCFAAFMWWLTNVYHDRRNRRHIDAAPSLTQPLVQ